ncbi:MAG: DNA polymerase III subunit chi [Gammaproteobacteria bacterium]
MTKVDFYIINDGNALARYFLACRIVHKAYNAGNRIHVHTGSPEDARQVDSLLWTFRDQSFVPHEIEPEHDHAPVTVGHDWEPRSTDVLINLASEVPIFFSRFERVAEVVDRATESRPAALERYRFYKDRGYELHDHKM